MKKVFLCAATALLLLCSSSCTHRLTDFTVISTRNIPLGQHATDIKKADKRVKGKDTSHMILFFPIGSPNMKEAIDRAIDKYPGAIGLADGVIKSKSWWALLYGQNSYIAEGTPIYEYTPDMKNTILSNGNQDGADGVLFFHEVKSGETLSGIAKQYSVSMAEIIKWNQLSSSDVNPGQKIKVFVR